MECSLQRQLTIRQLRHIVAFGQELRLSKCAEKLHTTQQAASRALAMLESMLGVRLFDRITKRIASTAAGLGLIQHANRILAEIDQAEDHLRGLAQGAKGEIRITDSCVLALERVRGSGMLWAIAGHQAQVYEKACA